MRYDVFAGAASPDALPPRVVGKYAGEQLRLPEPVTLRELVYEPYEESA